MKTKLMEAFMLSTRRAYSDFVTPKLGIGESDDVYAADLRRLLTAAGLKADGKSPVLIEQFIHGLPSDRARQLRTNGETFDVTKCVVYARGLSSMEQVASSLSHVSAAATNTSGNKRVMCYKC